MLRQIMVIITTPLGHTQEYNQGVTIVFIMTRINKLYSNNTNNNHNNKTTSMSHTNLIMVFNRTKEGKIF